MTLTEQQIDRAAGVLVGTATGDALGAGYEFTHPSSDTRIFMKGGGTFDWAPGEWTDDTSMAVCVAEGLSRGAADLDTIAAAFVRWYDSGATGYRHTNVGSALGSRYNGRCDDHTRRVDHRANRWQRFADAYWARRAGVSRRCRCMRRCCRCYQRPHPLRRACPGSLPDLGVSRSAARF